MRLTDCLKKLKISKQSLVEYDQSAADMYHNTNGSAWFNFFVSKTDTRLLSSLIKNNPYIANKMGIIIIYTSSVV